MGRSRFTSCCCCCDSSRMEIGSLEEKIGSTNQNQDQGSTRNNVVDFDLRFEQDQSQQGSQSQTEGNRSRRSEVRPYPPPEMRSTNKLEKSRQSARECRARKKLRYQYLDDMILERE